ncbi:MAG TPA: hypothetical protein EYP98_08310 [Planctomycetes bacterium]|nr:hypothetical protein [Planctomycetota bacterium]
MAKGPDAVTWLFASLLCGAIDLGSTNCESNARGLLDMTGNVMERTWDAPGDYSSEDLIDPMGAERAELVHVIVCGGSWYSSRT